MALYVVLKSGQAYYDARETVPIAVRHDFVKAKLVALEHIDPPGDNYVRVSWTLEHVDHPESEGYYTLKSWWRSTILPAMEHTVVYGPEIWAVSDHD